MHAEPDTPLFDDPVMSVPPCTGLLITTLHNASALATQDALRMPLPAWTFEPWIVIALLLVAVIYLRGWWQLHRRLPGRFTRGRLIAFQATTCTLFLALFSPLHDLSERLLQFHMIQHLALMMVAPSLFWLGTPILPLLRGLPRSVLRYGLRHIFAAAPLQRLGRLLTHPLVCLLAFMVSNIAWHVPRLYELALHTTFWHDAQHVCFLATGLLFWWPVVQPWPNRPRWPRWTILPYLLLADIQNTALSAFLIFSEQVLYPSYAALPRWWGISALEDQATAGVIMWVPGSMYFLIPASILVIRLLDAARYVRREKMKDAVKIDYRDCA